MWTGTSREAGEVPALGEDGRDEPRVEGDRMSLHTKEIFTLYSGNGAMSGLVWVYGGLPIPPWPYSLWRRSSAVPRVWMRSGIGSPRGPQKRTERRPIWARWRRSRKYSILDRNSHNFVRIRRKGILSDGSLAPKRKAGVVHIRPSSISRPLLL